MNGRHVESFSRVFLGELGLELDQRSSVGSGSSRSSATPGVVSADTAASSARRRSTAWR